MSLFISGMNLSVIVFPPANPCSSSLHVHLSSLGRTQWGALLPKSFQHQPFSVLQGEKVTPEASLVASQAQRSLLGPENSDQGSGGRVQWLCSPAVALPRWKETCQAGYRAGRVPYTYPCMDLTQPWGWRRCLMGFPGQTDAMRLCRANSCRFAGLGCSHDAGSSFKAKNPETWEWFSNARTRLLIPPL